MIMLISRPWTEPAVMGTRQNQSSDENKCGAESAESVLNVITDLDVLEVENWISDLTKTTFKSRNSRTC